MSNKSKAKAIADLWMSDTSRYWDWPQTMTGLGIDLSMVPARSIRALMDPYMTYLPHVYFELDQRKRFCLRDGIGLKARFKVATTAPEDKPEVERYLAEQTKRKNGIANRIETRVDNLKAEKILPRSWSPTLNA
jgi:hypothetical protein